MRQRNLARIAVTGATILGFLGVTATAALAVDRNRIGQVDRGDTGVPVWCAQHVVHTYNGISIGSSGEDSDFGSATESGVKTYQARKGGLLVDGVVGNNTGHAMFVEVTALKISLMQHGDPSGAAEAQSWLTTCHNAFPVYK